MILEIDLQFLLQHQITAHQFIIAKLISENKYVLLKKYILTTDSLSKINDDIKSLQKVNFISPYYRSSDAIKFEDIVVTDKFLATQEVSVTAFEELYTLYPVKVQRPNGSFDYLRADKDRCKKIYKNMIRNNKSLHAKILECLRAEIEDKELHGQLPYMKRLSTWLTTESWKGYDTTTNNASGGVKGAKSETYGTSIE